MYFFIRRKSIHEDVVFTQYAQSMEAFLRTLNGLRGLYRKDTFTEVPASCIDKIFPSRTNKPTSKKDIYLHWPKDIP